jgi:N-acyl-D-amino-acid deacylase
VLGKYVREDRVITLPDAIRKLTRLPATNLKLRERGELREDYYADIVIFDPAEIRDNATYQHPHQYAGGMIHVIVNGEMVLRDGQHTGATPGRIVRGPGWRGWSD